MPSDIRLPADASGPRVASSTLTEDSVQRHIPRYRPENNRIPDGSYSVSFTAVEGSIAAQTDSSARPNLILPVGSTKLLAIKRVQYSVYRNASNARILGLLHLARRYTFTGTSGAALVAINKFRGTDASPSALAVEATTGLTISNGITMWGHYLPTQLTTGSNTPTRQDYWLDFDDEEAPVIVAGEGFIPHVQLEVGASPEGGRFIQSTIFWNEFSTEF